MFGLKKLFYSAFVLLIALYAFMSIAIFYYGSKLIDENYQNRSKVDILKLHATMYSSFSNMYASYENQREVMLQKLKQSQQLLKNATIDKASLDTLKSILNEGLDGHSSYDVLLVNQEYVIEQGTNPQEVGVDFKSFTEITEVMQGVFKEKLAYDISIPIGFIYDLTFKTFGLIRSLDGTHLIQLMYVDNSSFKVRQMMRQLRKDYTTFEKLYLYHFRENHTDITLLDYSKFLKKKFNERMHDVKEQASQLAKVIGVDPKKAFLRTSYRHYFNDDTQIIKLHDYYHWEEGQYFHTIVLPFEFQNNIHSGNHSLIMMRFDETEAYNLKQNGKAISVAVWFLLSLFIYWLSYQLRNRLLQPLSVMTQVMDSKQSTPKSMMKYNDEINMMSRSYNNLLIDLKKEIEDNENLLKEHRDFTANVLHQLRTPLSVMKISLENIKTKHSSEFKDIESSIIMLEHNFSALEYLSCNKGDNIAQINFSQLLNERIGYFLPLVVSYERELITDIRHNLHVKIDPLDIEYLIDNNISNALKYGTPHRSININLTLSDENIVLSFISYGKVIKNPIEIFERYHREESSKRGFGIGLHIVKEICERYDILIDVNYYEGRNIFNYYFKM